jgi:hypothetical protein
MTSFGSETFLEEAARLRPDEALPKIVVTDKDERWEWTDEEGRLHREHDLPARVIIERGLGDEVPLTVLRGEWFVGGVRSREGDSPAVVERGGHREWWLDGAPQQRESDAPNVLLGDGGMRWVDTNGAPHRENNKPAVIDATGDVAFYVHGVRQ